MAKHRFEKGNPGGPGRPKGSRVLPLEIIFRAFGNNAAAFEKAMESEAKENTVKFFEKRVQPHLPKEWTLAPAEGEETKGFKITIETK